MTMFEEPRDVRALMDLGVSARVSPLQFFRRMDVLRSKRLGCIRHVEYFYVYFIRQVEYFAVYTEAALLPVLDLEPPIYPP